MTHRSLLRLGVALVLSGGPLACATAPSGSAPPPTSNPTVRCHTVLEVRPGVLGSAGSPVPVEHCEPEIPAPAPSQPDTPTHAEDDEAPLGSGSTTP